MCKNHAMKDYVKAIKDKKITPLSVYLRITFRMIRLSALQLTPGKNKNVGEDYATDYS